MNITTFQNYLEQCFSGYHVSQTSPENRPSYPGINFYINRKQTLLSSTMLPDSTNVVNSESDLLKKLSPSRTLTENDGKNQSSVVQEQLRETVRKNIRRLENNYKIYRERLSKSQPTKLPLRYINLDLKMLYHLSVGAAKISDQFGKEILELIQKETFHIRDFISGKN